MAEKQRQKMCPLNTPSAEFTGPAKRARDQHGQRQGGTDIARRHAPLNSFALMRVGGVPFNVELVFLLSRGVRSGSIFLLQCNLGS